MIKLKHYQQPTVLVKKTIIAYQHKDRRSWCAALADQTGFTLIELIAVIILLSVLAAVAVPRYIDLDANAQMRAIDAGISELNGREGLAWSNIKLTPNGWQDDPSLFAAYDKNLGDDYLWSAGDPNTGGGEIRFGSSGAPITLTRSPSTESHPGYWRR